MIKAVIVLHDKAAKTMLLEAPLLAEQMARGRNDSNHISVVKLDKISTNGFLDVAQAKDYAKRMASANPGKVYLVLTVAEGYECPPSPLVTKAINERGEFVPIP